MTPLGPSILLAGPPFCTAYAFHAYRHARARYPAILGLILAGAELAILIALMIIGLVAPDWV